MLTSIIDFVAHPPDGWIQDHDDQLKQSKNRLRAPSMCTAAVVGMTVICSGGIHEYFRASTACTSALSEILPLCMVVYEVKHIHESSDIASSCHFRYPIEVS